MYLRKYTRNTTTMMRVGMLFLIMGMLSIRFLPRTHMVRVDFADGVTGVFYGLAIGSLIVSIRTRSRGRTS